MARAPRLVRVLVTGAAAAALAASLGGCGSSGVTGARLDAAVGPTFARLYALQQRQLGHVVAGRLPDASAHCRRGAAAAPERGAGDDWACTVVFPFPDGHLQPISYDVTVQPLGCYTADGPAGVVGQQRVRDAAGRTVTNPLFAFDGCFDAGG